ncbi:hypothetical protein OA404_00535 [SAR86 cluster bacterium]|nr:hypothetical protein [SAR86 cluster bacterium]
MKNLSIYFSIVILFFVSINISAQEKKQEYSFPGFTLKKCLADYEIKKSNARRVAKLPSRAAQKYLKTLYPALEEDDLVLAKEILDRMNADKDISETDKAQMFYYYAYVYFSQDNLRKAKQSYKSFLQIEGADPRLKSNVIFSLAQIAYTEEKYTEAIKQLKEWLTMEANPSSTGFDIIAASHWQLKNKKLALKNAETGLCVAKANKSKPRESTYNLLLALYNEDGKTRKMLELYEELVIFHPKKKYWTQLSGIYGELKQESNQLTALEAAFDQELLDKKNEYTALYQLLMRAEAPYKAAKVMDYGIKKGFVKDDEKNLKMLAQGWHMAQELEIAEPIYEKAAKKSEEGELYVFLGQIYLATDRYDLAKETLQLGLKKGKLKDPVTVNILLGQVSYEQQNFVDATKFFRTALDRLTDLKIKDKKLLEKRQDKLRAQALTWLTYTEKEAKRVKTLELRRKDLEES